MKINKNIGVHDRIIRFVLGLILLALGVSSFGTFSSFALIIASLFCFFEATFSWCAFYQLIGKNTCPIK